MVNRLLLRRLVKQFQKNAGVRITHHGLAYRFAWSQSRAEVKGIKHADRTNASGTTFAVASNAYNVPVRAMRAQPQL